MSRCVELPSAGRPSAGLSALQQYGDSGSDSDLDMDMDMDVDVDVDDSCVRGGR